MNIGFDGKRALWNHTGLGNYSRTIINSLLSYYPSNNYYCLAPKINGSFYKDVFAEVNLIENNSKYPNSLWRSYGIYKDIEKLDLNIYHGLSNELPFSINQTSVKKVVTIHDLIFLRYPKLYKPIDAYIYKKKFEFACNAADVIIAISEQTKRDIIQYFQIPEQKIKIVYQSAAPIFNNIATSELKQKIALKYNLPKKFILNVGTIEERKNGILLINALPKIQQGYDLVFIGKSTSYKSLLENQINKLGLKNKVHFIENVTYEDLPICYQLASVFCYPSKFEGFGIPILEALMTGTPVVACTGSCLEEAGGPNSLYVHPNDAGQLAKYINNIITDSNLSLHMIEQGKIYAQNFDPAIISSQMMEIYNALLLAK